MYVEIAIIALFIFIYSLIAHGISANPLAKWLGNKENSP
jgi:hypothetical protein